MKNIVRFSLLRKQMQAKFILLMIIVFSTTLALKTKAEQKYQMRLIAIQNRWSSKVLRWNPEIRQILSITIKDADTVPPELEYKRKLDEFNRGKIKNPYIYKLILMAMAYNDTANLSILSKEFIGNLISPYAKDDLLLVAKITKTTHDPGFLFYLKNSIAINNILGKNISDGKILEWIDEEINHSFRKDETDIDWINIRNLVTDKYGKFGEEAGFKAPVIFYYNKQNWKAIITPFIKYAAFITNEFGLAGLNQRFGAVNVNNIIWEAVFQNCTDNEQLNDAAVYMQQIVKEYPDYFPAIDTYANILYKLGRVAEAIKWEEKAVGITPENVIAPYEEALYKMMKGIPTWSEKKE